METTPTLIAVPWNPSVTTSIWMNVLGTIVALVSGYLALGIAFGTHEVTIIFDLVGIAATVAIVVVSIVAHEGVHGLAALAFGGRPTFGAGMSQKVMPYFYCTAPGHRFTVAQYVMVALAPTVVVTGALMLGLLSIVGWWFVLAFALHLSGCIGDWLIVYRAVHSPRGSLIEDTRDGFIMYHPSL